MISLKIHTRNAMNHHIMPAATASVPLSGIPFVVLGNEQEPGQDILEEAGIEKKDAKEIRCRSTTAENSFIVITMRMRHIQG
jgi:hypothetical protein